MAADTAVELSEVEASLSRRREMVVAVLADDEATWVYHDLGSIRQAIADQDTTLTVVATTDALVPCPTGHIAALLEQLHGGDTVVGVRFPYAANVPPLRRPAKWLPKRPRVPAQKHASLTSAPTCVRSRRMHWCFSSAFSPRATGGRDVEAKGTDWPWEA